MSFTITAPDPRADGTSVFGPTTLHFQKGKASADELSEGLSAYLHSAGYEVEEDAEGDEPLEFDPAKSSIPAVLEYLATADEDERARVLAAESDGKARKGILEATADDGSADGDVL